ncbi:MAG: hypothetical protein WEB59_14605 [Thermoanaerobaculia bacterium]
MRRTLLALALLLGLATAAIGDSEVTRSSRPLRLLRTWYDSIKTPAGDLPRRVDILYDYGSASALERAYTLDGRLISSRRIVVNPPTPSPEEIEEAFAIVRADAEMARIIGRFSADLEGGFLIEEARGTACGPGARCLLIQVLSPDHSGLIRVMGVDLVKRNIPYRTFVPSEHAGVK